ncbi:MAG TPA: NYN domain-containing protein, partial [Anaerolineales bacterium]|nr:NYN domain-containing protein [Anaerolineales bacterium]
GQARTEKFGSVIAHFVRLGTTADSAIKARLQRLEGSARNWVVVSSDHQVQDAARALHARVTSSDQFAALLRQARRSASKSVGEPMLSSEEIDEWLKLFDK